MNIKNRFDDAVASLRKSLTSVLGGRAEVQEYRDYVYSVLSARQPGLINTSALPAKQNALQITQEERDQVHRQVWGDLSKQVLEDGVVTEDELKHLAEAGTLLGLKWSDLPEQYLNPLKQAHALIEIQKGRLPQLPPGASALNVQPGEIVHLEVPVIILEEKVIAHNYVGGTTGVSFRIARGITYRVGGIKGRSMPVTGIVAADQGILIITNQRIAFIGGKKSFTSDWGKLLYAEPYSDGIRLAFSNRSKPATMKYQNPFCSEVVAAVTSSYVR